MSAPIDACPACGAAGLLAICRTVVEYAIANDGDGDQDWSRGEVDDDSSVPAAFRCGSCGVEFKDFTLDDRGYLIGLGPGDPGGHDSSRPQTCHPGSRTRPPSGRSAVSPSSSLPWRPPTNR